MSSQIVYDVDQVFGCWVWSGRLDRDGYPVVWHGRKPSRAHRVVYELERGAIPEGKALDHVCRNRMCVAPHHLEPVDQSENELRKAWRYRARRTTCSKGHSMATAMMSPFGGLICRTCNAEARR